MYQIRTFDCEDEESDDTNHCCIMPLMSYSLYDLLKLEKYKNGLPFALVLVIFKQVLKSLDVLHENKFIHADIKPEIFS